MIFPVFLSAIDKITFLNMAPTLILLELWAPMHSLHSAGKQWSVEAKIRMRF